jgi:hypothetical protein
MVLLLEDRIGDVRCLQGELRELSLHDERVRPEMVKAQG